MARRLARGSVVITAALIVASGLSIGSTALPAHADDTDGISGTPASETGPDGRSRFSYEAAPGQQLTDNYSVSNTGTTSQTMRVFSTDAFNTEDGAYGLLETDAQAIDAGAWVTFENGAKFVDVPLAAGESKLVTFTLTVPADASPGDHAAGIVTSVTSPQGQILVDRRVATRLYVRVPGDLQAALTVGSISSSYQPTINPLDGTTTITFTVRNSGNIALGGNMLMGVNTYFGISAAPIVREELAEMLPRSTRVVTIEVPGVAQLGYLNSYVSLAPTLAENVTSPGPLAVVDRDTVAIAMPWWLIILLVVGGAIYLFLRIRRRIDAKRAEEWVAHMEAEARRKLESDGKGELVASGTPTDGDAR
ncbi:WxL protein peptidoglycan domain-containing protein [Conyzicola sp.]|uniref:WxL protein peptidoglycan domain-containing protein n=1 Tax=Conyzicola sp. TaxID=1969404 RepID=UPI00398921E1